MTDPAARAGRIARRFRLASLFSVLWVGVSIASGLYLQGETVSPALVPVAALYVLPVLYAAVGVYFWIRSRSLAAAQYVIDHQFDWLEDDAVLEYRTHQVAATNRAQWDAMIAQARISTDNRLRLGHLLWADDAIQDPSLAAMPPRFEPPLAAPYRAQSDIGMRALRTYLRAKRRKWSVYREALDLERAALQGSPIAMTWLGGALCRGDFPGREPDPVAGLHWLEKAVADGRSPSSAATLGKLLIAGHALPTDVPRGLRLLKEAARRGHEIAALELASLYMDGRRGISRNESEAVAWALSTAPRWRRLLNRIGLSQRAWVRSTLRRQSLFPSTL